MDGLGEVLLGGWALLRVNGSPTLILRREVTDRNHSLGPRAASCLRSAVNVGVSWPTINNGGMLDAQGVLGVEVCEKTSEQR